MGEILMESRWPILSQPPLQEYAAAPSAPPPSIRQMGRCSALYRLFVNDSCPPCIYLLKEIKKQDEILQTDDLVHESLSLPDQFTLSFHYSV